MTSVAPVCDPFSEEGCTTGLNYQNHHFCTPQHGFPKIFHHGDCGGAVVSKLGWVHGKCCGGEVGHAGNLAFMAPRSPQLRIKVFEHVEACLSSPCPFEESTRVKPCRCTFPTHVCLTGSSDKCTPTPSNYALDRHTTCTLWHYHAYHSIPDCAASCDILDDCGGFQVEVGNLKTCYLFTKDMCTQPIYSSNTGTHVFTKKRSQKTHKRKNATFESWSILLVLYGILLLPIIVTIGATVVVSKKYSTGAQKTVT